MRQHFPSTGRVARLADAFASWRAAVITFQLLAPRLKKRFSDFGVSRIIDELSRRANKAGPARGQRTGVEAAIKPPEGCARPA